MKEREAAIAAIRTCKTRDSLDQMLVRFDITEPADSIECLDQCMYNPEKFYSLKPINIEDELEFTKQIFLTGTWRLNELYDRLGIEPARANA
jgi:hypothetical protein